MINLIHLPLKNKASKKSIKTIILHTFKSLLHNKHLNQVTLT